MKCSLGMLCEPLKALGLHSHKAAARKTARPAAKKSKVVKSKTASRKVTKAKTVKKKRR